MAFIDIAGYISLEEFRTTKPKLLSTMRAIRVSESINSLKSQLRETKERDTRRKLQSKINQLETFFNG